MQQNHNRAVSIWVYQHGSSVCLHVVTTCFPVPAQAKLVFCKLSFLIAVEFLVVVGQTKCMITRSTLYYVHCKASILCKSFIILCELCELSAGRQNLYRINNKYLPWQKSHTFLELEKPNSTDLCNFLTRTIIAVLQYVACVCVLLLFWSLVLTLYRLSMTYSVMPALVFWTVTIYCSTSVPTLSPGRDFARHSL